MNCDLRGLMRERIRSIFSVQIWKYTCGCFMTMSLAFSNESISMTAILIIAGPERTRRIHHIQAMGFVQLRICSLMRENGGSLEKRNVRLLSIPNNPEGFEIMMLLQQNCRDFRVREIASSCRLLIFKPSLN